MHIAIRIPILIIRWCDWRSDILHITMNSERRNVESPSAQKMWSAAYILVKIVLHRMYKEEYHAVDETVTNTVIIPNIGGEV